MILRLISASLRTGPEGFFLAPVCVRPHTTECEGLHHAVGQSGKLIPYTLSGRGIWSYLVQVPAEENTNDNE